MPQLVTLYRVVTYTNECPHTWQRATALIADRATAYRYLKHLQNADPRDYHALQEIRFRGEAGPELIYGDPGAGGTITIAP